MNGRGIASSRLEPLRAGPRVFLPHRWLVLKWGGCDRGRSAAGVTTTSVLDRAERDLILNDRE